MLSDNDQRSVEGNPNSIQKNHSKTNVHPRPILLCADANYVNKRDSEEDGVDGQHDAVPDGPPSQLSVATYRHVTNSNPGIQGATDTDFSLSNLP